VVAATIGQGAPVLGGRVVSTLLVTNGSTIWTGSVGVCGAGGDGACPCTFIAKGAAQKLTKKTISRPVVSFVMNNPFLSRFLAR
jgi:hypothetical protein